MTLMNKSSKKFNLSKIKDWCLYKLAYYPDEKLERYAEMMAKDLQKQLEEKNFEL